MTVVSPFLKSPLNFLFNNLKRTTQFSTVKKKACQNLNCQKHSFKRQSGTKSTLKPTWSEKMTVVSTFLKSSLNFLSNDIKNATKRSTVRKKSGVKV